MTAEQKKQDTDRQDSKGDLTNNEGLVQEKRKEQLEQKTQSVNGRSSQG